MTPQSLPTGGQRQGIDFAVWVNGNDPSSAKMETLSVNNTGHLELECWANRRIGADNSGKLSNCVHKRLSTSSGPEKMVRH